MPVFMLISSAWMAENKIMGQAPQPADSQGISSAVVFEHYREKIYRYIRRLVKDPTEAEDLLQETFLTVHRQLPSLRDPSALSAWLYRIATNLSYDHLRKSTRYRALRPRGDVMENEAVEAALPDLQAPNVDVAFERTEMSACVQEFIAGLSDDYRTVILLHDLQGLTSPEIAAILDDTLDSVKIRLHRARLKLKAALEQGCTFAPDDRGVFTCDRK